MDRQINGDVLSGRREVCVCMVEVCSEGGGSITPTAALKKVGIKRNLSEGEKGPKVFIDDTEPHTKFVFYKIGLTIFKLNHLGNIWSQHTLFFPFPRAQKLISS